MSPGWSLDSLPDQLPYRNRGATGGRIHAQPMTTAQVRGALRVQQAAQAAQEAQAAQAVQAV